MSFWYSMCVAFRQSSWYCFVFDLICVLVHQNCLSILSRSQSHFLWRLLNTKTKLCMTRASQKISCMFSTSYEIPNLMQNCSIDTYIYRNRYNYLLLKFITESPFCCIGLYLLSINRCFVRIIKIRKFIYVRLNKWKLRYDAKTRKQAIAEKKKWQIQK